MKESFRWFGPSDPVSLKNISQAGATSIVSALHEISNGDVWSIKNIQNHQALIKNAGLEWDVVESVPVHEDIKLRTGNFKKYIENYKLTLKNLAVCGITNVCYNFMPVLDWTRTHLHAPLKEGSTTLSFNIVAVHAFDLFILKRKNVIKSYSPSQIEKAKLFFESQTSLEIEILTDSIIAGLPGSEEDYTIKEFNQQIDAYSGFSPEKLRNHLIQFLEAVIPMAETCKLNMCIHPDDPPFSLFGIPRVVSNADDLKVLFTAVPSINNGLTFCTGSFGVLAENDLLQMFADHAQRIHFLHFRSIQRDGKGNFIEANHLEGNVDMYEIVKAALTEERRRNVLGQKDFEIPMRPDHGHQILDDLNKKTNPGYSAIGRLRGLAELRGLALGIKKSGY
tara:strand:- start:224 stop:1402 length:1179 start_codon:yes stop_codon:yes gene_type:complete